MKQKLNCIFLIDDSRADNFLHERKIAEADCAQKIISFLNAEDALEQLKTKSIIPDLIFLDINMPAMDGWIFLDEYERELPEETKKAVIVMMLTTSLNPEDKRKAEGRPTVKEFINKPLTREKCEQIVRKYFSD